MKPRMFIGSSVEGKDIAEYLQLGLEYDVETTIWHQGIFGLSDGSLEALVKAANDFDFAALVLTPDDLVTKRGTEKGSPRDNVVFELGLFMGALGRERTFIVYNRDKKPDLPSDLAGVTPATFANRSDSNLQAALGPVCTKIKLAIKVCGLKAGHAAKAEATAPEVTTDPSTVVVDKQDKGDYVSITQVLNAVKAGTRIIIHPGVYREGIVIDKPVEIIGEGERSNIVIEVSDKNAVLFQANSGRIANLTMHQAGHGKYSCVDIIKGRLELEDCDISSQGEACIAIQGSASPCLRRNRIHGSKAAGVFVAMNGQGTIEDNDIFATAYAGVMITDGGNPILRRNRIYRNGEAGICVFAGGGGIFEDNDLRDNIKGAWKIAPDCEANVQRRGNTE